MEIRKIKRSEIANVAKIAHEEIYDFLPLVEIENWLKSMKEPYFQIFVAKEARKLVGFICWRLYDQSDERVILEIFWMAIKRSFRGKDIGAELLLESLADVRQYWKNRGRPFATILVAPYEKRGGAQRFFEKILEAQHKTLIPKIWGDQGIVVISKIL